MPENKPETARKKAPARKKRLRVGLDKISEVIFVQDGEEYFLVPLRFGKYMLTRVPR